jgi:DNA-binding CsgD family transcriptional regulator
MSSSLDHARSAFSQDRWADAYASLATLDRSDGLAPADLERFATAAFLSGKDIESRDILARAHRAYLDLDDPVGAGRCAFWLAFGYVNRGDLAQAGGWFARARRLLDEARQECAEQGYLLIPQGMQQIGEGQEAEALSSFTQALEIGHRFHDNDLVTLARHGQGRVEIRRGNIAQGFALLDEIMIAVTGGEVSSKVVGMAYCGLISACHETYDLRRAYEWTTAFSQWCTARPDLVPFRGYCQVRRAEILQLHGAWDDALDEARRAGDRLSTGPSELELGAAVYQQGEIHRLRGEFATAEEHYRQANQLGHLPQPGLALLRLAQGQTSAARAAIVRSLDTAMQKRERPRLLFPYVEIMLAAGEVDAARAAADELTTIANDYGSPLLRAMAVHANGAVLQAFGEDRAALKELRQAAALWQELGAPHELGKARVLAALACRVLDDCDSADLELDAARQLFRQLGAAPDLERVDRLFPAVSLNSEGRLTAREVEVLRLIARGDTNRAVANALAISEKTVARHMSNIFTKLGLSSRAGATAYAYQHKLV